MKEIRKYIIEKLRINKDTAIDNPEFYFTCDIEDVTNDITSEEIDDKLKTLDSDAWFGPNERKNHRGNTNNKFWYAIYCYLVKNGPSKQNDIVKFLKPDGGTNYARLFSQMNKRNIFTRGEKDKRGLLFPNPPEKWRNSY